MSRRTFAGAEIDRWADGRRTLRAANPRMAELMVYLHDLAARLEDGRLDLERLRTLDDDAARDELTAATYLYRSPGT